MGKSLKNLEEHVFFHVLEVRSLVFLLRCKQKVNLKRTFKKKQTVFVGSKGIQNKQTTNQPRALCRLWHFRSAEMVAPKAVAAMTSQHPRKGSGSKRFAFKTVKKKWGVKAIRKEVKQIMF